VLVRLPSVEMSSVPSSPSSPAIGAGADPDRPSLVLSWNGSPERREGGVRGRMEFDVEAPCSVSCKRGAVPGKALISCHPSELEGGVGVVESMAASGLSKRPASSFILSARRLLSSASASEALKSSSPNKTIKSFTPCQKNQSSISTIEGSSRAHLGYHLSYRLVLIWSSP